MTSPSPTQQTTIDQPAPLRRAIPLTIGLAALWIVLAFVSPDVTYHLAPLLVAAVPPVILALDGVAPSPRTLVRAAMFGQGVALTATGILTLASRLEGPSFFETGGAPFESVVFAVIGAGAGFLTGFLLARSTHQPGSVDNSA